MVKLKLVSIEHVLTATTKRRQGFDQASLQTLKTDGNASAFGIMLKDLISLPSLLLLQQSDDLLAFIGCTGQTTYLELQKVGTLLVSGSAILSLIGQLSERLVACTVVDPSCAKCTDYSASGGACNGDTTYQVKDIKRLKMK
jgi:hypothetical protein